jgi:hypothetical protein
MTERPAVPSFTGLEIYRDLTYRYSLLYPMGWHQLELETTGGTGVILAPVPDDPANSFSAEARDLGVEVTSEDLATLREGFWEGIESLPEVAVEAEDEFAIGDTISIEATITYRDGDATRKRRVRLLYKGSTQVRLIAQGNSPAEYEYWLPMFNQMMRTFQFADWWGEITGYEWLPSMDALLEEDDPDPATSVPAGQSEPDGGAS